MCDYDLRHTLTQPAKSLLRASSLLLLPLPLHLPLLLKPLLLLTSQMATLGLTQRLRLLAGHPSSRFMAPGLGLTSTSGPGQTCTAGQTCTVGLGLTSQMPGPGLTSQIPGLAPSSGVR